MSIGTILVGSFFGLLGGTAAFIFLNSILAALAIYSIVGVGSAVFAAYTIYNSAERDVIEDQSKMISSAQR